MTRPMFAERPDVSDAQSEDAEALQRLSRWYAAYAAAGHGTSIVSCSFGHEAAWKGSPGEYVPLHAADIHAVVERLERLAETTRQDPPSGRDLAALAAADQESLEDTATWLDELEQEGFDRQVLAELRGKLDAHASEALRQPINLRRWQMSLVSLAASIQTQLSDPTRKTDEYADWRKRALYMQQAVLRRRREVDHLITKTRERVDAAREEARTHHSGIRATAGDAAIKHLMDAHRADFLTFLREEYEARGEQLRTAQLAELHTLTNGGTT